MSFVSYAQNFEDAVLWRALKHIEAGVYVDVGAQHPIIDSVSKAFYERGWRGIHIEPVRAYADLLRADRPDETVLEVALGESDGTMELHVVASTGLSTGVQGYADRHQQGGFAVERVRVPVLTLTSALRALAGQAIHWLKIDVEGFEEQVLKGWDSHSVRPWVLVVEATVPGSTATDFARWDPIVLGAGYSFVYFDGLNRFYLADEHADLRPAFGMPPNVFDHVQVSGQASWPLCGVAVDAVRQPLQERLDTALTERDTLQQLHQAATAQLASVQADLDALRPRAQAYLAERDALAAQRAQHDAARARIDVLSSEAAQAARDADQLRAELAAAHLHTHQWWQEADRLTHQARAIYASTSWRVTAPLRAMRDLARGARRWPGRLYRGGGRRLRAAARRSAGAAMRLVLANATLNATLRRLLQRFPQLKQTARRVAARAGVLQAGSVAAQVNAQAPAVDAAALSPRAARLLAQLDHARDAGSY